MPVRMKLIGLGASTPATRGARADLVAQKPNLNPAPETTAAAAIAEPAQIAARYMRNFFMTPFLGCGPTRVGT